MLTIFLAEMIGTLILILLGDGVVANVTLNKAGMKGAGSVQITFAWGFAVMVPAFIFGAASGAHFNPALTLALALEGSTSWQAVPIYIAGQFIGAFLGACLVWLLFKKHFEETEEEGTKLGVFCTSATIPNKGLNFLSELVATFVLVFAIKGIGQVADIAPGLSNVYVCVIIIAIGMSLGGLTGYAINPARDWGPRLAHTLLPIKGKGSSHWEYAWVTLLGPIVGGVLAVGLYNMIPW